MITKATANPVTGEKNKISKQELRERIEAKLVTRGIITPESATSEQLYHATVQVLKEIMLDYRNDFKKRIKVVDGKKVCYLCMEFLVGRALKNDAINLGVYDELCSILTELGSSFESIYACEVDPGLGNGGLGRLAACFMDSLTAQDYAANGYSLLYENGLFKQRIVDGDQVELPDEWLAAGGVWLVPHPERSFNIRLGGKIEEKWCDDDYRIIHTDFDEVKAVPYDLLIPGTVTNAVNTIRLWRARPAYNNVNSSISQYNYVKNMTDGSNAEQITKQLYGNRFV